MQPNRQPRDVLGITDAHVHPTAWDQDPLTAAPERIREMRCPATPVAGEVVHRHPAR